MFLLIALAAVTIAACAPAPVYRPRQAEPPAAATGLSPSDTTIPPIALAPPLGSFDCRRITSRFGSPRSGSGGGHEGIDIDAETGDDVLAAAPGTVSYSGRRGGYGNLVVIEHDGGFSTSYGHLAYATVRRGDRIDAASRIGRAGKRGRATGSHLHFELRHDGRPIDPAPYLCLDSTPHSP